MSEKQKHLNAYILRIGLAEQRKILVRGFQMLRFLRASLVCFGVVVMAPSVLILTGGMGHYLSIGNKLILDGALILGVGGALAPVWMKKRFANLHAISAKLDAEERTLGNYGVKMP